MSATLEQLEEQSLSQDDSNEVPPSDIIAFNELRSCADLYRMHMQGILDVNPSFQREFVWKNQEQTRFIDSLIKQLPIPSMCFAMDYKAQRWMVIDGLQRMSTIIRFLGAEDWELSALDDIEPSIAGKTVQDLKEARTPLHKYYSKVENLTIPITVLRCDFTKKAHLEYLFTIFHRLNTGGTKLTNQEIRNCIYGGSLNDFLWAADQYPPWRRLNKMRPNKLYRYSKQEIILRFLAFHDEYIKYDGHLAKFLNAYMHKNQHSSRSALDSKCQLFQDTVDILTEKALSGSPPPKLSLTVLEATLVGIGRNLHLLRSLDGTIVAKRFQALLKHPDFSERSLKEGLSKKPRVIGRMQTAIDVFAGK